ncbi:MAG TPA: 7-cyano-7-deazaguanine synthase QueC [Caulobacteraceae bacterium]|nr:7-cyano-7-deazaguanine synthase QueC [Caulobacteraceae bacterium]
MPSTAKTVKSALVLFSGGQDSAVCLAWALERFERVETIGFDYGQRHAEELKARTRLRRALGRAFPAWGSRLGEDRRVNLRAFGAIGESALTADRAIEMTERGLPSTFVPGRNLVFLVYAAALADRRGLDALVGGMCETDYSGYPDCRRATLDAMETALGLGIGRPFPILTPLMRLTKAETWALANGLGGERLVEVIVQESHTCYRNSRDPHAWGAGCGDCPACALRATGWSAWVAGGRPALAP